MARRAFIDIFVLAQEIELETPFLQSNIASGIEKEQTANSIDLRWGVNEALGVHGRESNANC